MTYEEKEEKIIKWFRDNNVFEKFMYNLRTQRPDYNPFTKKELDKSLISKSFIWADTTEGRDFWKSINEKYKEFYKNLTANKTTNKMEEKSIKINIPEGYEIDEEKSNLEQIVFKKKEIQWRKEPHHIGGYYISSCADIVPVKSVAWVPKNSYIFATKKQAKSALAMAQISQIMTNDERFGGPITDEEWLNPEKNKYVILRDYKDVIKKIYNYTYAFLAFHTREQRDLFLKENEDLVKQYLMLD